MYCDYEFYKNVYYGSIIAEDEFPKYAERASDKLDYLTLNRLSVEVNKIEEADKDNPFGLSMFTSSSPAFTTTVPTGTTTIPAAGIEPVNPPKDKYEYIISAFDEVLDEKISAKVKKSVCKLAEIIHDIDIAEKANRESIGFEQNESGIHGKVIKSISSGAESITYADNNTNNNLINAILTDKKAQDKLFYDTVREFLTGTGLLYAGI